MTTGVLLWLFCLTITVVALFSIAHMLSIRITALEAKKRPRKPKAVAVPFDMSTVVHGSGGTAGMQ